MTPRMTRQQLARAGVVLPAGSRVVTEATKHRVVARKREPTPPPIDYWCDVKPDGTWIGLPEPPSANRYWRVWRGRVVKSAEARAYARAVAAIVAGTLTPLTGAVALSVHWHRGRKSGDLDNRLKVTLDALKGLAYHDDKQVTRIEATRDESIYRGFGYIVVCVTKGLP